MESNPLPPKHVVYTEFDDCEAVLVDLDTKRYYTLNETAMLIWRGLERGRTKSEIVQEIVDRYEVTVDHANTSLEQLLSALAAHRLLRSQA